MTTVTRKLSRQDALYTDLQERYTHYPESRLPIPIKKKLIRQNSFRSSHNFSHRLSDVSDLSLDESTNAKRTCDFGSAYYKKSPHFRESLQMSIKKGQNKTHRPSRYTKLNAPVRYIESANSQFKSHNSVCKSFPALMCYESYEMECDNASSCSIKSDNVRSCSINCDDSRSCSIKCKETKSAPIDVLTHETIMQKLNDAFEDQNLGNKLSHLQNNLGCEKQGELERDCSKQLSRNLILPLQIDHHVSNKMFFNISKSQGNTPVQNLQRSLSQVELKHKSKLPRWALYTSTIKKFASLPTPSSEINNNKLSASCSNTPLQSPCVEQSKRGMRLFSVLHSPKKTSKSLSSPKISRKDSEWKASQKCLFEFDDKDSLTGYLYVNISNGKGFNRNSDTYVVLEMDSYGHYFKKAKTKTARGSDPHWDEEFDLEIEACTCLRLTCYNKLRLMGDDISGKCSINLARENLLDYKIHSFVLSLDRGQSSMSVSLSFATSIDGIKKTKSICETGVFGVPISVVCSREKSVIPVIVISCIKEIEKRGMDEVGIYRLSGIASEIQNLRKLFNEHTQNAVLVLGETDIHAVAGLLKLYFRELPQSLFTGKLYHKFVEGLSITDPADKEVYMLDTLHTLPRVNKLTTLYLFEHLRRVSILESVNKMGINNLATVFGPTVLRTPSTFSEKENERSSCNVGTFDIGALDVMSQVGVFRYFLALKNNPRTCLPEDDLELWRRLDKERAKKLEGRLLQTAEEFLI